MAKRDKKAPLNGQELQRFRHEPAKTLSETWDQHARLGATLLDGARSGMFSGRLGMCARKCNSTLSKARQVAVLIDAANPRIWTRMRLGTFHPDGANKTKIPTAPKTLIIWIVARAFRDYHQLLKDDRMTREVVDEIAERQRNAISILSAPPPAITADAADELKDESSVKRQRERGSTAVAASNGQRLR